MTDQGSLSDKVNILGMRDTINAMIRGVLSTDRPLDRFGVVSSINYTNWSCTVDLVGGGTIRAAINDRVPRMGSFVRLSGQASSLIVEGILGRTDLRLDGNAVLDLSQVARYQDLQWHIVGHPGEPALLVNEYSRSGADPSWGQFRFRHDEVGCVYLEGLAVAANYQTGAVAFTLPAGFRPSGSIVFHCQTGTGAGKIQVDPNGNVTIYSSGTSDYVGFYGVSFMAEDIPGFTPQFTALSLGSGWTARGGGWLTPRYYLDPVGDLHLSGMMTASGSPTNTAFTLPIGNTNYTEIYLAAAAPNVNSVVRLDTYPDLSVRIIGAGNYKNSATSAWISLDGIVIPAASFPNAWMNSPLINSWVNYGTDGTASYAPFQYLVNKNGIAAVRGLIKSGTPNTSFGLPATGMLPKNTHLFLTDAITGLARIDLGAMINIPTSTAGIMSSAAYYHSATNGYVSLSGIRWNTRLN